MPSLIEQTEEQLKGYAAQQDAISSIMMRFVESLEKIETKVGVLEKGGDSQIVELQRQIENLAFNIQGHAGKGVEKVDEEVPAVKEITPPPSPGKEERVSLHPSGEYSVVSVVARNRWRWAMRQIRVKKTLAKNSMAKMKVDSRQSVSARLERLENHIAGLTEALKAAHVLNSGGEDVEEALVEVKEEEEEQEAPEPESEPEEPEPEPEPEPEEEEEPDTRLEDLQEKTETQDREIKGLKDIIADLREEITELKTDSEKKDDSIKDMNEKGELNTQEVNSLTDEVASLAGRVTKLAMAAAESGQDPSILQDHALEKAKDAMTSLAQSISYVLGAPDQNVDDSISADMKAVEEALPASAEELEEVEEDKYILIMGKSLRLIRKLKEADLADPDKPLLEGLVSKNRTELRSKIDSSIDELLKAMNVFSQTGKMQIDVYDIQDWISGQRLNTIELQKVVETLKADLALKAQQSALAKYAYREDLDTLNNGVSKLMANVEEMREKLLAEIAAGRDKTADGAQRLQEVADGLGDALRNCETMSAAMSNKAEASEMAQALSELGSNLEMIASNTFPKVELQRHLSSKIDKADASKMMEAAANGSKDQNIDLGKPFFAVYKCDKPFEGTTIHDLYAGESVSSSMPHSPSRRSVSTAQEYRAPSVDASSLPELHHRPNTGSPTSFKPHIVNAQASVQSTTSALTVNSDVIDGASTTSYSRLMPAKVRVRTSAGGGVPGAMSREGIRQMKLRQGSKLAR